MPRVSPLILRARLLAVILACLLFSCALVAVATTYVLRGFLLDRLGRVSQMMGR